MSEEHQEEALETVSAATCNSRFLAVKWVCAVLLGLTAVFLALVVYVSSQAYAANANVTTIIREVNTVRDTAHDANKDVATALHTHISIQKASEKSIVEKLEEVKTELSAQRKEQRLLLEKILELQIKLAQRNGIVHNEG